MSRVSRHIRAAPSDVFNALVRPETYPQWLVGCRDIRSVDETWPEVGSHFHHRVGVLGPLTLPDSTKVLEIERDRKLVLEVRARPFLRGRASFLIEALVDDRGDPIALVTLDEVLLGSLAALTPLVDPLLSGRNIASLNALVAYLNTPVRERSDASTDAAASPEEDAPRR